MPPSLQGGANENRGWLDQVLGRGDGAEGPGRPDWYRGRLLTARDESASRSEFEGRCKRLGLDVRGDSLWVDSDRASALGRIDPGLKRKPLDRRLAQNAQAREERHQPARPEAVDPAVRAALQDQRERAALVAAEERDESAPDLDHAREREERQVREREDQDQGMEMD
ncbi:MAG: hypothetical protein ACR2NB_00780 [Solirubrobacteraceae bacterium]